MDKNFLEKLLLLYNIYLPDNCPTTSPKPNRVRSGIRTFYRTFVLLGPFELGCFCFWRLWTSGGSFCFRLDFFCFVNDKKAGKKQILYSQKVKR